MAINGRDSKMFILRTLEKIVEDKDIRKSCHTQLRKTCESALDDLRKELNERNENEKQTDNASSTALPLPVHLTGSRIQSIERYLKTFEMVCGTSRSPKMVVLALDCLQKLIAHGHIDGRAVCDADNHLLINRIVATVCNCFTGPNCDDSVQLQVIKALLTVVTSQHIEIHQDTVILVIKTCVNIFIGSRNLINQTTAKATLTQMLNVIFTRMENAGDSSSNERTGSNDDLNNSDDIVIENVLNDLVNRVCNQDDEEEQETDDGDIESDNRDTKSQTVSKMAEIVTVPITILPTVVDYDCGCVINETGNATTLTSGYGDGPSSPLIQPNQFANIYKKDAFLVFRSLCKLFMKPLSEQFPDPKSHELRSKILSLHLLLSVLQNAGPVFRSCRIFISAIKQYLCIFLINNGVSPITEIFELSLSIFVALLSNFKAHLKMQIGVFFNVIFLKILETPNSTFEHKWMVIQALTRICADAQSVVDIYVNYDCDLLSQNIFTRLVNDLSKLAHGKHSIELGATSNQEKFMRLKALECLVSILKCMTEWSKDLYVNSNVQSTLGGSGTGSGSGEDAVHRADNCDATIAAMDMTEKQFEVQKHQKDLWETGIKLFNNNKPKKGIQFLQEQGFLTEEPSMIAKWLLNEERLDKTVLGNYLGLNEDFVKNVMYEFVDQMNFADIEFIAALRLFLDKFRLPGEAQIIDRFIEKFASRYCFCNPNNGIFSSADTAYVLGFSIIMLTTDLHSPKVKVKMTKQQYIRMNSGINDSKDLPEEYLSKIYDEIAGNEIKMTASSTSVTAGIGAGVSSAASVGGAGAIAGSGSASGKKLPANTEKKRKMLWNMEMGVISSAAKSLMESVSHVQAHFTTAKHLEHVRPMFKIVWTPFLAAFSVGLQNCDDNEVAALCLDGIRFAIRIACIFHMELVRDAFVQALARFTLLTANLGITEMKPKNIDTIKTLIAVAHNDANYLGSNWYDILKCISQLELAQLIGTGMKIQHLNNINGQFLKLGTLDPIVKEQIGETSSQSVIVAVDRIFTGSTRLDGDAIVEFVKALCKVSLEELAYVHYPRMFSLQKIVEISYYNMERIRLQWSRTWQIIGEHFNTVGCSANEEVSNFAIDSLRQLSTKFIEKGELSNFRFQKDFLRPFEHIMKRNPSVTIKDMVVQCVSQIVHLQASNIKSGWKNIFSVFHLAASDRDKNVVELAFRTTSTIVTDLYTKQLAMMIDSFQDAVKCLSEFACNSNFAEIKMEAIRLIGLCAEYVNQKPNLFIDFIDMENEVTVPEADRIWSRAWFSLLFSLSCVVSRSKLDIRTRALTAMFDIVKSYGHTFQSNWWTDLFKIVFRIFDDTKLPDLQQERAEWMTTTCNQSLYAVVGLFIQFYDRFDSDLLIDFFARIEWCAQQNNEFLARSALNCFENLVLALGVKFDARMWTAVCECIATIFDSTLPRLLFDWKLAEKSVKFIPEFVSSTATITANSIVQVNGDTIGASARNGSSIKSSNQSAGNHIENSRTGILKSTQIVKDQPIENDIINFANKSRKVQFNSLIIKCIVQVEIIQAIDHIVFSSGVSRKHDSDLLSSIRSGSVLSNVNSIDDTTTNNGRSVQGMYGYMNKDYLIGLVECLMNMHNFAKEFNSNDERRMILAKGELCGPGVKPALLSQETQSLACSLRILFRIYADKSRSTDWTDIENKLIIVIKDAFQYYLQLRNENHRAAWTILLLLIFTNLLSLSDERFVIHMKHYYVYMCQFWDFKSDFKTVIQKIFLRLGQIYNIANIPVEK